MTIKHNEIKNSNTDQSLEQNVIEQAAQQAEPELLSNVDRNRFIDNDSDSFDNGSQNSENEENTHSL